MAQKKATIEVNSFVGGLVSDASPLTFPPNASIDEDNIVLNTDGSRNRRLGMDYEDNSVEITTTITSSGSPAHTTFKWENAGGVPSKNLLVVQFGNEIKIFDFDNTPLSSSVIYTYAFDVSTFNTKYSYAVVDGFLVIATGTKLVTILTYDNSTSTITLSTDYIKVRDLFGVADTVNSVDLEGSNNITTRPTSTTDAHTYNLRNQSFGKSLVCVTSSAPDSLTKKDPLAEFFNQTSKYPSNSDSVNQALYNDANLSSNRTIDRFFVEDLDKNPMGSTHAATGYFIIDALERGTSRLTVYSEMMTKYSELTTNISSLPLDKTTGGPTIVNQFAGRFWYGGFSGITTDGDSKSPKLSSYVFFSRLVQDPTDITKCYQDGDPTSRDEPDIVDTDGGFIRIDEAFGIKGLKTARNCLFVIAQNGVWRITGGSTSEGFTATSYSVIKVLNKGCVGSNTIVEAEGNLYLWGDDGIYIISVNEYGDWIGLNYIQNKLQDYYNDISSESKEVAQGYFDSYESCIHWIFNNYIGCESETKELIYNTQLKSFSPYTIKSVENKVPKLIGIYETPAFKTVPGVDTVYVGTDEVMVGSDSVIVGTQTNSSSTREIGYICVTDFSSVIKYKFCFYTNDSFVDWYSYNNVGIDTPGYIITGYVSGGDFQRNKDVPFLTVYMRKTETGFVADSNGDFVPINPSSCSLQIQWEWSNSINSKKWSSTMQVYRHNKQYFPTGEEDTFNNGFETVTTKNKLRGCGRVLSLKFSTSPLKDFNLLGWSYSIGMNEDV